MVTDLVPGTSLWPEKRRQSAAIPWDGTHGQIANTVGGGYDVDVAPKWPAPSTGIKRAICTLYVGADSPVIETRALVRLAGGYPAANTEIRELLLSHLQTSKWASATCTSISNLISIDPGAGIALRARDEWERSLEELHDLLSEWTTEDGVQPTAETVGAIEALLPAIRSVARLPDFEVNDDGSITLRWKVEREPRSFALHFGRVQISAVLSQPLIDGGFGEALKLRDEVGVVRLFSRPDVAALTK